MVSLIVGLGTYAGSVRAEIQNDMIGFSPNHVFESAEAGEHIDVMSGNMTLTIPIGPRLKLTDDFSWGLTLHYNAKVWEHDCPVPFTSSSICAGTLVQDLGYGNGWSMLPGRVYHNPKDYAFVYRLQLEDGSEHLFCYSQAAISANANCESSIVTSDGSRIAMSPLTESGVFQGWKAVTTDGRTIEFKRVVNSETREALATRVATTATKPNNEPKAFVDYTYTGYAFHTAHDSQGRDVSFTRAGSYPDVTTKIQFNGYSDLMLGTYADLDYFVRVQGQTFKDPCDLAPNQSGNAVTEIRYPALASSESYKFEYTQPGPNNTTVSYGWLTKRTLPTGAVIDYKYDSYRTTKHRPYHTELWAKTLTMPNAGPAAPVQKWSWDRFSVVPHPALPSGDPEHPNLSRNFSGSNPYKISTYDPFNNLTLYEFHSTLHNEANTAECNPDGLCTNNWTDGLLSTVSTFVGPNPDSAHLVKRVDYKWDSDLLTDVNGVPVTDENGPIHKMFHYRPVYPTQTEPDPDEPQKDLNTMAVNVRQIEEKTFVPRIAGGAGHTVTIKSLDWYPNNLCFAPQRKDEYIDDVLYRSTFTKIDPSGGNDCRSHKYVEVTDGSGHVVSRVDRKFRKGLLECEVRRKGTNHVDNLLNCDSGLAMELGDIATINTFDDPDDPSHTSIATGAVLETMTKGGDTSTNDTRTITMTYLTYPPAGGPNTGYLKTKKYGFDWKAVDRTVDFCTGWTGQTRDPAGNLTSYSYDALGRLTRITPASLSSPELPTFIEYRNVKETHVTQILTSTDFIETVYFYDDLGRLITTKRRNAAGTFDIQKAEHDLAGRVTRKSEWATDGTAPEDFKWTTNDYTMFTALDGTQGGAVKYPDPLGRIHGVTTPDDPTPSTPTVETSYDGEATTVTVRDIRGGTSGASASITSKTVYTNDALGRLVAVDAPGFGADAAYAYDENDNLTEVRLTDPADSSRVQIRRFDYDRLGRLRLASNPESGTVAYTRYDGRGNLVNYIDARQKTFTVVYDFADREMFRAVDGQTLSWELYDPTTSRLTERDSYEITNNTYNLVSRVQFGYGDANTSDACDDGGVGYKGLNGRLAWQKTQVAPWFTDIRTDLCQNALGLPSTTFYPDFSGSGRSRTKLVPTYKNGYQTTLHDAGRAIDYITGVAYAAGGVPTEIDRVGNKDLITLDVRNRPSRFQTVAFGYEETSGGEEKISCAEVQADPESFPELAHLSCGGGEQVGYSGFFVPSTVWDSGTYAYDMAGNVATIGTEEYYYDALSRLAHADVPGIGMTHSFDYGFDAFGSMTGQSHATSSAPFSPVIRTYAVDWRNNRLSQQTVTGSGSPMAYSYDENGNMIRQGDRGHVFDAENRLREIMDPERGRIRNYSYDASGYRVRVEADGNETFYFRDASGQVLSEFQRPIGTTGPPSWNKDYVYAFGKSVALVKNEVPETPARPTASPVLSGSLTLNWSAAIEPDILGYVVSERCGTSETPTTNTVQAPVTSWQDNYVTCAASLCRTYSMQTMDTAANLSAPGPQLMVCPLNQDPVPVPTNVSAAAGNASMTIRWSLPSTADPRMVLGYFVERRVNPTTWIRLDDELLTAQEFLDVQVTNGSPYTYRVKTVDTANRTSAPSVATATVLPNDTIAPGKVGDVSAEADRAAGSITVFWKGGVDLDVNQYRIYRSLVAGALGEAIVVTTVVSGQENCSYTDTAAVQGQLNYYTVKARDSHSIESIASDQVSARPRVASISGPNLSTAEFVIDDKGTTSDGGLSSDPTHQGHISEEDDDDIYVTVAWGPGTGSPSAYHIYRKGEGEAHYTWIGTTPATDCYFYTLEGRVRCTYFDHAATKGEYTYYVTAWKQLASGWEESVASPSSGPPASEVGHVVKEFVASAVKVRNLIAHDGREWFWTENKESRLVTLQWSRVVEPGLVGYNVYRMCGFNGEVGGTFNYAAETFGCEPVWVRLNTAPLSPEQRTFTDTGSGGLEGGFYYAVRPVGPQGVEGYIGKVLGVDLSSGDTSMDNGQFNWEQNLPTSSAGAPYPQLVSRDTVLDPNTGIHQFQRTGSTIGKPLPPTQVTHTILQKLMGVPNGPTYLPARFAEVFWTFGFMPMDLVGFHIEMAGSPQGPWQRLTKYPVAYWERRYITEGISLDHSCTPHTDAASGHTECLVFRVIAVDEEGKESSPGVEPPPTANCPKTPGPPMNLRASDRELASEGGHCTTRLEWDAPEGEPSATEYYVYRAVLGGASPIVFFYDTQHVTGTEFTEQGGEFVNPPGGNCSDAWCPYWYAGFTNLCSHAYLSAYYVTARVQNVGGESPRSNLIFWQCGRPPGDGYTKLLTEPETADAIAALEARLAADALVCWNTDGNKAGEVSVPETLKRGPAPAILAIEPMLHLGQSSNPAWRVYDLHTDHLGNVRVETTTDSHSGFVTTRHDFFPFGEEIASQFSYNTHQYTGHERDKDMGMDYMLARYYEAGTARFLSTDPAPESSSPRSPQTWNRYTYALNNPLKFIDPSGSVVEDVKLKTEGQNAVANPSTTEGTALSSEAAATLGPEETATSVLYSVNVEATVSAGDSPGNYQFNQQSYAVQTVNGSPSASAKPNDSPAAANTTTTGNKAVMYDAPGVKVAGTTRLGNTIEFSGAFKTTAVDKGTGQQSGPTLYWGVTIKQGPDGVTKNTAGPITPQAFEKVKQLATAGGK